MATLSGSESGVTADFNLAKAKMSQLDKNALKILTCQEDDQDVDGWLGRFMFQRQILEEFSMEYQTTPAAISKRPKAFCQGCQFIVKDEGFKKTKYGKVFCGLS